MSNQLLSALGLIPGFSNALSPGTNVNSPTTPPPENPSLNTPTDQFPDAYKSPGYGGGDIPGVGVAGISADNTAVGTIFDRITDFVPLYLGTAEDTPTIDIDRAYVPWYDDEGGTSFPADDIYESEQGLVVADISRWNEPVYAYIACVYNQLDPAGGRGYDPPFSVGTSMAYEGATYPLWVQFPYAAKLLYADMPPCYRFYCASLLGPDRLEPLNHLPSKRRLIWRARRYLNVVNGFAALYDHNMTTPPLPVVN